MPTPDRLLVALLALGACGDGSADESEAFDTESPQTTSDSSPATDDGQDDGQDDGSGDGPLDGDDDDGSDDDDDDDGVTCASVGFAQNATSWALPDWAGAEFEFPATASPAACPGPDGSDHPTYVTTDLTGDGIADLVVTWSCDDGSLGGQQWMLHRGTPDGFGDAEPFTLPSWPGSTTPFPATFSPLDCGAGRPTSVLVDLTGDSRPDLVVTDTCDDDPLGSTQWMVFENTGGGFGEASPWALPAWPAADAFPTTGSGGNCNADLPTYGLTDLTGDGLPDLVITYACGDGEIGRDHWTVFVNEGDRFEPSGSPWSLPDWPSATFPFPSVFGFAQCDDGTPTYGLSDLDGDGRSDLVVTWACGDGAIGESQWLLFPNDGSGFSDSIAWPLPDWPASAPSFSATAEFANCETGVPGHALTDLDGDARPDLVITDACGDGNIGEAHWLVFPNDGDAFADALTWPLPDWPSSSALPFSATSGVADCGLDRPTYSLADLTGAGAPDLLVTWACEDGAIGDTSWLRFRGACR